MQTPRFRLFAYATLLCLIVPPAANVDAATGYGPLAVIGSQSSVCRSVRAHYRTPPNTSFSIDLNAYGYSESVPPLCAGTSPWVAFGYHELFLSAQLWTTSGTFCTEFGQVAVPTGSAGSGWGIGKGWNKPGSGVCKTATQYAVHAKGTQIFGAQNTSVVVFSA